MPSKPGSGHPRRVLRDELRNSNAQLLAASSTFGFSNHYNDLRSLQPEEDLIQLASKPSSPLIRPHGSSGTATIDCQTPNFDDPFLSSTKKGQEKAVTISPTNDSLLDLDSIPSQRNSYQQSSHIPKAKGSVRSHKLEGKSQKLASPDSIAHQEDVTNPLVGDHNTTVESTNQHVCDQCDASGILEYCNVCDAIFCGQCWDMQLSHKKQRLAPGGIPHERTSFDIAKKIKAVLEPGSDTEKQDRLHVDDENTTWFGVVRDDGEFPLFQDYGRFAEIMADTQRSSSDRDPSWMTGSHDYRYPSLVSFVGETGAGKSTIIKLVIDLSTEDSNRFATPVIGSAGIDVPTSADVHLYSDPQSSESANPILYADCEGLRGGERTPMGARFRKKQEKASKFGRVGSAERKVTRMQHTSERELTWANTNTKRTREFVVTHLYPRLLYTFSDVVVFVLKNPRVIESVFEKLVDWAAAALEKSSNQPVLPHAIIVLNALEYDIDPRFWSTRNATVQVLESMSRTIYQNATFKKYSQFWRERHRQVETIGQLIHCYYSSVRVVRIPTSGRPNLIQEQVQKLQAGIVSACNTARERRAALRMLMNTDELQPYLRFAFDHFAYDLETPFDFVHASFTNSPVPLDFGGNILKLALSLMEAWVNAIDGEIIFRELSYMVASCIMLDSARSKIRGVADQIFPQYLEHVEAALENFCDRYWRCEFVKPGKPGEDARCVNVRSGHDSKGHQLKNGKVFAVGDYVSRFSFEEYRETFLWDVYSRLDLLLKDLRSRVQEGGEREAEAAAEIHRDKIMAQFYNHATKAKQNAFISHSTCFCCLFEPPEHALPCGHILCTSCLRAYGRVRGRVVVEIDGCPLESLIRPRHQSWRVTLKPEAAGIRILTLDGGGIRGIVELEALRLIERAMGGRLAVQNFFDLIVGTSTGGIIALGLGAKDWSVENCTRHFEELSREAFTRRTGGNIPGVSWLVDNYNHSKYRTKPLQAALTGAFSEDAYLFGGPRSSKSSNFNIKVAVTATSNAGLPVILANYNRRCGEKLPYHFQRPEGLALELKIWEAARATSAAPRIFKPFCHEASKQVLIDGAVYHNNPIHIADKERKLIWPHLRDDHPDIILSIGTTYKLAARPSSERRTSKVGLGVVSHGKSSFKIAIDHIASALDSEKTWNSYLGVLQPPSHHKDRYVRLNPQLDEEPPNLDEVERMNYISMLARANFLEDDRIQKVANQLIASSFYFDFERSSYKELPYGAVSCSGHIHCRLPPESTELREIGRFLKEKMLDRQGVYFVVQEEHRSQQVKYVAITQDIIEKMIRHGQFKVNKVDVQLSNNLSTTKISLYLGSDDPYLISKFPRSLLQDDTSTQESRKTALPNSKRWASRTPSQQLRRKQWVPPDLSRAPQRLNTITNYSDKDYVIGNSSRGRLQKIAARLAGRKHRNAAVELDGEESPVGVPDTEASTPEMVEMEGSSRELSELAGSQPALPSARLTPHQSSDEEMVARFTDEMATLRDEAMYVERMRREAEDAEMAWDLQRVERLQTDGWMGTGKGETGEMGEGMEGKGKQREI